ncbi:hypothetical protein FBEOM_7396 [Fusarium beomiforme]|uniref:Uncharacterized protein n=1 Tax=Fusarium beomiforme TaxID=44412 RepID=A0A9P5AH56_9HYPO|nr:hypothetical protein FBEOM_7396 [Fusarium beomiforme]
MARRFLTFGSEIPIKKFALSSIEEKTNKHEVKDGIVWFGFSEPPPSSDEHSDNTDSGEDDFDLGALLSDYGDGDERPRRLRSFAVPMRGRLDWERCTSHCESNCDYKLSHHKRGTPKDEMRHVLAESSTSMARLEPVIKSCSFLIGSISPGNLDKVYKAAEENGNYEIFGL